METHNAHQADAIFFTEFLKNGTVVNYDWQVTYADINGHDEPFDWYFLSFDVPSWTVNRVAEVSKTGQGGSAGSLMLPVYFLEIQRIQWQHRHFGGRTGQFILDHLGEGIEEIVFEIAELHVIVSPSFTKASKQKSRKRVQPFSGERSAKTFDHYRHLAKQQVGCCHLWKSSCRFRADYYAEILSKIVKGSRETSHLIAREL